MTPPTPILMTSCELISLYLVILGFPYNHNKFYHKWIVSEIFFWKYVPPKTTILGTPTPCHILLTVKPYHTNSITKQLGSIFNYIFLQNMFNIPKLHSNIHLTDFWKIKEIKSDYKHWGGGCYHSFGWSPLPCTPTPFLYETQWGGQGFTKSQWGKNRYQIRSLPDFITSYYKADGSRILKIINRETSLYDVTGKICTVMYPKIQISWIKSDNNQ